MLQSLIGPPISAFSGRIGVARHDITPPVGIYARNWGAAKHDVAESIHRPLTVGAIVLKSHGSDRPLVLVEADVCAWPSPSSFQTLQKRVLETFDLNEEQFIFAPTHTHSSPRLSEPERDMLGGDLVTRWLADFHEATLDAVRSAFDATQDAILDWGVGYCGLAATRDLRDPAPTANRWICGYDPSRPADDTLLVGRITDGKGRIRAVIVNYACHPTTLSWENRAISPDFVGAMRETISAATGGAQVYFLQGASGELAPKYQYVADAAVADRHGRQLGYATLAALEDMEPPAMKLVFDRVVESGAPLAVWRHEKVTPATELKCIKSHVDLSLKPLPSAAELDRQLRDCTDRILAERIRRKRDIRLKVGDGERYRLPLWCWQIGRAVLVGAMTESYSAFQVEMRRRFPDRHIACVNLLNGSIGYLAPAGMYDEDIYQVWQSPFDRGSFERFCDAAADVVGRIVGVTEPVRLLG